MKYFLSIFLLSFCLSSLSAQERHFVFIQSDAKQPFYVSLNGKLYSSTASGYLIIPKLADGNYNLTVGFAQNAFPEQTFNIAIQNKDLGFDLKNFNEKGWGLFNLQSLDITMASAGTSNVVSQALTASAKAPPAVISFEKKKDTTPVASKPPTVTPVDNVTKEEEVKKAIAKTDNPPVNAVPTTDVAPTITSPAKPDEPIAKSERPGDVKKVSEVTGEEGVHLSYVEGTGKTRDTINVIIPSSPASPSTPNSSSANPNTTKSDVETTNQANSSSSAGTAKSNDVKFLDIKMSAKNDTSQSVKIPADDRRILENSNCKNIATDDDYAKLRKKMASETSDDKMIIEARKVYRNKCFTTSQIKRLSTLFLSDEARFKFFDVSFVSVADAAQYYTLQNEFIDPAFVNRFKSLLQ
jgi:hypothetical protein